MLDYSFRELELVKKEISKIKASHSYDEIETSWIAILTHLGRAWNKCLAELKSNKSFDGLKGQYKHIIDNDELLTYLREARNATEHSIQVVIKQFGNKNVKILKGDDDAGVHVTHRGNNVFEVRPVNEASKKYIVFVPRCHVVKIVNYGEEYPAPTQHLGKDIGDDLLSMASLAVKFYEGAFDNIRGKLNAKE